MIENNNEPSPRTPYRDGAKEESGLSRRNSASSQLSSSTTSPNYDSGNISDLNLNLRPASLSSAEDDSISNDYGEDNKFQHLLREKDQSLFLALQDVRKLKSELERLSKSEKWYKSELRLQKNSRMEILEKLYTNERKFTQENQRLQDECIALYARCSEVEIQLQTEKDLATKLLQSSSKTEASVDDGVFSRDFELAQQQEKIADQEQLINMLRNQKRSLLNDLQKLSCEKDEIILPLQNNIAHLEDENRTITKRCLQLVEAKILLEDELLTRDTDCSRMSNEVLDLQITVKGLQEKLHSQITDLNQKEHEVNNLKIELSQKQHSEEIIDSLQKKHQQELFEKQQTIYSLKDSISSLKLEICALEALQTRYNEQQCRAEQLKDLLEERTSELEELRRLNERKSNQISHLPANTLQHPQTDQENQQLLLQNIRLQEEVNSTKHKITSQSLELDNLRKTKQELNQLSEKYLQVCKLYEKSKFDLDMRDVTVEKYKFEKEKDTREIATLREKLVEASKNLECQKSLSTEFEFALSKAQQEKRRLETENQCNMDKNSKLKAERSQNVQILNDKDVEIGIVRAQLYEAEEKLTKRTANINQMEMSSSESRVASIRKLISLQSDKVQQLNEEQKEWEHLLTSIAREESPIEEDVNSNEFDSLNQMFEDQNLGLMQLNEAFYRESICLRRKFESAEQENKTFQEELEAAKSLISDLEKQVDALESTNCDYQKEIAHLAGTNERLIDEFNEDFSRERENHKQLTKQLQLEIKRLTTESDECKTELQQLQAEVDRLNTSYLKDSQKLLDACDSDSQRDESANGVVTQDRILQNVIETEHRRKMSRYDIHIRSLLSSVKSYKKSLDIAECRYATILAESKDMIGIEEFRAMEADLKNLRKKFDSSQKEVDTLKHQLKTVKDQFYVNDASKSSNSMDFTNLMDDYKKLIQQSQTATKRPSTSDIYKLINKSNNFVPNLTNVSTSVDGLREDVQQICTAMQQLPPAGRGSPQPQRKMSLLEELKLAENGTLC